MTDDPNILYPRPGEFPHLSECLLFIDLEMHCTCDDDSPDWTSS
jgi:hypothetical protein